MKKVLSHVTYVVLFIYAAFSTAFFMMGLLDAGMKYGKYRCKQNKRYHKIVPTYKIGCRTHKHLKIIGDWLSEDVK